MHNEMKEMILSAGHDMHVASKKSVSTLASEWLNRRNNIFSMVMEERVSNLQVLHIIHCITALLAMMGMAATNLFGCVLCLAWFASALLLASKKGGLA